MTATLRILRHFVATAVAELCAAFERHGYNPTPIIDLGVLVASADGKVEEVEREMMLDVFQTLLQTKLTAEVVDIVVSAGLEVIEEAGSGARARLVGAILKDCDAVEPGVRVALALAFATKGLEAAERAVVKRVADAGGLLPARLDEISEEVREYAEEVGGPTKIRRAIRPSKPPP